jgi:hypothetical protein
MEFIVSNLQSLFMLPIALYFDAALRKSCFRKILSNPASWASFHRMVL